MIGIYKITNNQNGHCYIGQSRDIISRWSDHKIAAYNERGKGYNYPLYRAIRKYGINNFNFQILVECEIIELNQKEVYYISLFKPEYNQTEGGLYNIIPQKLTSTQVKEIQNILIQDINGEVSHKKLAEQYCVSKDTIRDINVGRTWITEGLIYPLHYSKFDSNKDEKNEILICPICKGPKSRRAKKCKKCSNEERKTQKPLDREALKNKIRKESFVQIAKEFNVSNNTIRKWCLFYNLPNTKKEISSYSDEDWDKI